MTEIRYPFLRATYILASSLLLVLSGAGVQAEISTHEFSIASAPQITTANEATYKVDGDCTYYEDHGATVSVVFSYTGKEDVKPETVSCTSGNIWKVEVDISDFGSGKVDADGVLKQDVEVRAVLTDNHGVSLEHSVWVHRNHDASRGAPDLTIGLTENRTVAGDSFNASATCGAKKIVMNEDGLMTVEETDCARMVSTKNDGKTLAMTDTITGAVGACEFKTLKMNAAGDIRIAVDPEANVRCLDDKDFDGILDMQDPEPGTDKNNNLCLDSQKLIDNIAMTADADVLGCDANESITIQGVKLKENDNVCYTAGQFVQFVSHAAKDEARAGEPIFSVPAGASFAVATGSADCSNIGS